MRRSVLLVPTAGGGLWSARSGGVRWQLGELGGATGSVMGKGFSELSMTGMEAGHHGLSVDFEDFCERWECRSAGQMRWHSR